MSDRSRITSAAAAEPSLSELLEAILYYYEDHYGWALSRIEDLEDQLAEAKDTIRRLVEGDLQGWDT